MGHNGSDVKTYFNKYKTKKYKFSFQGIDQILIDTIEDLDALIDEITVDEFNEDERLPYWAEIWPSSIGLSEYLCSQTDFRDKNVLELGSGLGLCGIVAAKLGGKVTFSDYDETSISFCKHNSILNHIENTEYKIIDWRDSDLNIEFDVIIASDIIYEKRFILPVMNMIRSLLRPGGKAILSEPGRNIARDFFKYLDELEIPYKSYIQKTIVNDIKHDIGIYIIN